MHAKDIEASVDPITRQYIGLTIQEALVPSLNELWASLERTRAAITTAPDTTALEKQLETSISDKLAPALSSMVQSNVASIREELRQSIADLKSEIAASAKTTERLRPLIDALDLKIKRWADDDRYTITRAQVMKAMREAKK